MSGYNTGGREPVNGGYGGGVNGGGASGGNYGGGTTSYGAPIHTNQKYNVTAAQSPKSWATTKDKVSTYNAAAEKWNASAANPSLANLINNMAPFGMSMQAPEYGKPKTYTGGDYHLGLNPASLVGGLAGMYGSGLITGPLAGKIYNGLGGQNVMLSGDKVPDSWANPTGPMTGPPGSTTQMAGGNPMNTGGGLSGFPASANLPGGAPFGPQPTAGIPKPPAGLPAFFHPQIANHTVPQGYDSAFPLSDQDKALLYGKALMGAA